VRIFVLIDPVFVLEFKISQAVSTACFVLAAAEIVFTVYQKAVSGRCFFSGLFSRFEA
jgi:hypothetical protein